MGDGRRRWAEAAVRRGGREQRGTGSAEGDREAAARQATGCGWGRSRRIPRLAGIEVRGGGSALCRRYSASVVAPRPGDLTRARVYRRTERDFAHPGPVGPARRPVPLRESGAPRRRSRGDVPGQRLVLGYRAVLGPHMAARMADAVVDRRAPAARRMGKVPVRGLPHAGGDERLNGGGAALAEVHGDDAVRLIDGAGLIRQWCRVDRTWPVRFRGAEGMLTRSEEG